MGSCPSHLESPRILDIHAFILDLVFGGGPWCESDGLEVVTLVGVERDLYSVVLS